MTGSQELVRANQFGSSEADGASPIPGWSQKLPAQAAERLLGHNLTRPFTTKCSLSSHLARLKLDSESSWQLTRADYRLDILPLDFKLGSVAEKVGTGS